jgi:phosphatidylglycerol phospholipase C
LKRCFGKNEKIADCDWSYLSSLKTLQEPRQGMPRLLDLLEYLAQPDLESIWLLLDIKVGFCLAHSRHISGSTELTVLQRDADADELMSRIAGTIASVPSTRPWSERIVLGAWDVRCS